MMLIKTFSHNGNTYEIFKEDRSEPNGTGAIRFYHIKKNGEPHKYDIASISHEIINDAITLKSTVDLEDAICCAIEDSVIAN